MADEPQDAGKAQAPEPAPDQKEKDSRLWGTLRPPERARRVRHPVRGMRHRPPGGVAAEREEFPFVEEQGKEAVFQISPHLGRNRFLPVLHVASIRLCRRVDLLMAMIAWIKANEGVAYRYPPSPCG